MTEDIVADPYNWQFPQRSQLMSLQTINQKDVGFPKYAPTEPRNRQYDLTDIRGASPELYGYKYSQKECFINRNEDIEGSSPKRLIKEIINQPSFLLVNKDIKGTQPQINKFETTRKPFNPLSPQYTLPSSTVRVSTPPKFIRDSIRIDDIPGTKSNPKVFNPRNVDIYTEIEGSRSKTLFIPKDHIDILNVKDINEFLQFKTTRHTNPLSPTYITQNKDGKKIEFGGIKGSMSRRLHPIESNKINFNLTTGDVPGAWHGTHSEQFLRRETRKDFRETNITKDLPEAQMGSLKKGIVTLRHVNPLNPKYQFLGQSEGLKNYDMFTNPIKESSIVNASKAMNPSKTATEKFSGDILASNCAVSTVVDNLARPTKQSVSGNSGSSGQPEGIKKQPSIPTQSQKEIKSQGSIQDSNKDAQEKQGAQSPHVHFPKLESLDVSQLHKKNISKVSATSSQLDQNGNTLSQAQRLDKFIS